MRQTIVPLGEIIQPAKTKKAGDTQYPLLSMTMRDGLVDPSNKFKKRIASDDTSGYKVVSRGQLVVGFPIDEGVLSFQNLHDNAIVSPAYGIWDLKNPQKIHSTYVEKFLKSPTAITYYLGKLRSTTARRRSLDRSSFLALPVPLPSLEEQKRVAGILDQAASLCRLRTLAVDKLNTLGQAIFYEMFSQGAQMRPSSQLGELLTFVTSGGRGWAKYYSEVGNRFIRSLDVQTNEIGNEEVVLVSPPDSAEARRTKIACGDVLLTITGSKIGRAAPIPDALAGSFISQHVAILRPNRSLVLPDFLSFFLNMKEYGQKQIRANQYGQAKPGLNFEQIKGFQIPDISIEEQAVFVERVEEVRKIEAKMKVQKDATLDLFASLQHRAFRGEL
ncbi:restriction endonuclease subunit S [Ruegeria atlantica]|uniref:restriction endonuclease subunit S n=1 Tax=Ruegeria atlantica TaxID=81569 RepID=UPI0024941CE7|nr:restriction endonuclease subunit S [Ruegeria atlantica]